MSETRLHSTDIRHLLYVLFSEIGETVSVYVDWRTSSQPFGHYWFAVDGAVVVRPRNILQLQLKVLR